MITKTMFKTTITADRVAVNRDSGAVTTDHVEITVPGVLRNENSAFKMLCKELGIDAYTNIQLSKTGVTYAMTEETFMQYAKIVKEGDK